VFAQSGGPVIAVHHLLLPQPCKDGSNSSTSDQAPCPLTIEVEWVGQALHELQFDYEARPVRAASGIGSALPAAAAATCTAYNTV
jgi:hypothetical protein